MASSSKGNGPLLVPPSNFAMVEEGVYRSDYPTVENVLYLRHIGITNVVLLSIEQLPGPVKRLLASEMTGRAADGCLTRGPIRIVDIVDMRTWCVDGMNSGDDFSRHDMIRALDFAVDRRWHPVLFACPLGELQTNVLIGCMRRYQHWSLSSIFSECELYTNVCRTLRPSILHFIESWDPADYPMSAVNIQYRNREMAARQRSLAQKERRKQRTTLASLAEGRTMKSGSDSAEDAAKQEEEEMASGGSDLVDKRPEDKRHGSSVSSLQQAHSEGGSIASTPPPIQLKTRSPDAAFISTSGQRPPMMMRRAAAAARLLELQEQHLRHQTSACKAEEQAIFIQVEEGKACGVIWADWYLEALSVPGELKADTNGSPVVVYGSLEFPIGGELPPPHVLYAGARNPPALDARSTFTKEFIEEEDDD
ncbi:hypothetical protein JKF63_02464 [Porcisia hertigi]|uniref:Tyrosine phosphatase family protein n=1 Tax=Porcisia hertigi TaxID=2761500 RepID=A0A836LDK5_9TRYP|nr:hypothetical protein JKF63_02464 [Porcisia hertigi]